MGFFDSLSDLWDAATPWSTVEAEAVQRGGTGATTTPADNDNGEGEAEDPEGPTPDKRDTDSDNEVGGKAASGVDTGSEDDEKEEEEEEEEELVDPKEHFEEECRESKQCAPAKHHFEECVDRVTSADEGKADKKHPKEDCVEEFFHLAHCAGECAAPKVFAALK